MIPKKQAAISNGIEETKICCKVCPLPLHAVQYDFPSLRAAPTPLKITRRLQLQVPVIDRAMEARVGEIPPVFGSLSEPLRQVLLGLAETLGHLGEEEHLPRLFVDRLDDVAVQLGPDGEGVDGFLRAVREDDHVSRIQYLTGHV